MGFLANAAARSEMKVRDTALAMLREIRPDFVSGNVLLPCHIVEEVHNGFFVNTGAITVGIFRCQLHWWGHELEEETLAGLTSPNSARWLSEVRMTPPRDMGTLRGGIPEFVAGLAFGLPTLDESSLPDRAESSASSLSPVFEFTARDLSVQLQERLSHTEIGVIPFPAAADGIALQIIIDKDPLLYYRNSFGGWGERYDEQALGTVDGDELEDITLPRLSVHVAWDVVSDQFSARQRQKDTSSPPNLATTEAIAFLRDAAANSDPSVSELALSYLAHLQFWTPDELKVALGFHGPSRETFDVIQAVISEVRARLLVESVTPRAEDDGSYTLFIQYEPKSAVVYRLSPDGEWSEGDNPRPLMTTGGTQLSNPSTPQVVSHVAATIASVLEAEYDAAEGSDQPIEVDDGWVRAIALLQAVADGDLQGYGSAEVVANEYLDYARRWTSDSARAALAIGDRPLEEEIDWENIDFSSIDFSEFDLPSEGEEPKPQ